MPKASLRGMAIPEEAEGPICERTAQGPELGRKNAVVAFAIGSPVYRVQDTVAARLGQIKEFTAQKVFVCFAESLYGVVHPSGDDHFELTAVGSGFTT